MSIPYMGKSITVTHEVAVIKTINSGVIMVLPLIRRIGITYLSMEDIFMFESCFQKAINLK
jgi:hypothetical protein